MPIILMTVGTSGCGKSTFARKWAIENDAVLVDSDWVREYLKHNCTHSWGNNLVFDIMHDLTVMGYKMGRNVCYCATNLGSKYRISFCNKMRALGNDVWLECAIVVAPPAVGAYYNMQREWVVPNDILDAQHRHFQVPYYNEGWNSIWVEKVLPYSSSDFINELKERLNTFGSQDTPHHTLTLAEHSIRAANLIEDEELKEAAFWHDIGKVYTKIVDEKDIAHYYGHGGYGASCLLAAGFSLETAILVCYHMELYEDERSRATWRARLGEDIWRQLRTLHRADMEAH